MAAGGPQMLAVTYILAYARQNLSEAERFRECVND